MAAEAVLANMRAPAARRRLKAVCLLELLVQNCDMKLHRCLFSARFCATLLKMLERAG